MESHQLAQGLENFGVRLYMEIEKANQGKNIVFSPFSIQTCAAMARLGAEGETANELHKGLGFDNTDMDNVSQYFFNILTEYKDSPFLKIANKIYVKDGYKIQSGFNKLLTETFYAEAENINFTAREKAAHTMNAWVEAKTNNRIKNLIGAGALNEQTRLVLLNAIHFKAEWKYKFPKSLTQNKSFYIDDTNSVNVPMMHVKQNFEYGEIEHLDAKVLEMPYRDSNLAMLIILPNKRNGLREVEEKLKTTSLRDITNAMYNTKVIVDFPKFKTEFEVELKQAFQKLGMERMFGHNAEFGKMLETDEPLQVSSIIHKAFIEVCEEGTEAAAATGMGLRKKRSLCDDVVLKEFTADRPFIYHIYQIISQHEKITLFKGCLQHAIETIVTTDHDKHDEL